MELIDLSHTFEDSMPVYPGDPEPSLKKIADVQANGFTDHELRTAMHVGTHMDAPLHMIAGAKYVSDIPVEQCIGRGVLLDARGLREIPAHLLDAVPIERESIVLVMTGHSRKFREKGYYEQYPVFSETFARQAVALGVKIVGMDTPSPDTSPFPVHKILLGNEVLIMENLTNLELLLKVPRFTVIALPMKLHADAAPARVVAMVE